MDRRTELRARIDHKVKRLGHRVGELEDLAGDVRERVSETLSLAHHVRERPWTCLAVAVAGGLLIDRVLR